MKNLAEVSNSEQLAFISSFDHVLSDLDDISFYYLGVIWLLYKPLPDVSACINSLRRNGKMVHFVSNNSTVPTDVLKERLSSCGIQAEDENIITPIKAILAYLKKIQFNKKLYVIGLNWIKTLLREEGFSILEGPLVVEESIPSLFSHLNDDENIGAVLVEFDININYIKLQQAVTYLKRKDCIFIVGAGDARLPFGIGHLIGPHYYINILSDFSGREPLKIAKPSIYYNDFIKERFNNMSNPSRVLFIGDSISEDMAFASKCGYQKLLVLTGLTKKENLSNWEHPEEHKPEYYVESLSVLNRIMETCPSSSI
ncbi:hypothetical protein NQ315_016466 [Exocentrus adspersus]|uniref:4-nitrophenylphosphatase n=1 Tax=Exocentrus adspersus TaxID=1586481 RepID=A0AAV8VYH9_9CUCU|nr:hypothetical protein NQ315_016466 [Exocentrus adspersus]